ncbi:prepilin-type N-terminal cleavage/methylation domain-containing protein [Candidatus Peregrinibacteria bacterium]|nr:prepilin-type N-terminal cleavage/methylation domain-containing protein [Candidatus Peregrinibacteria bacterium]
MNRPGLSLIEVMVVLALVAWALATTLPFMGTFQKTETLRVVGHDVFLTMIRARHRAQTEERGAAWGVALLSGSYVLYAGASYSERVPAYDEMHAVSAVVFSGLSDVTFRRLSGEPVAAGTVTITHRAGGSSAITVNDAGQLSIE